MTKGYYTFLPDRAAVVVGGPDARAFLQSMVTQDVDQLGPSNPLLYSLLLTAQGKLHYDFFMWNQNDSILLECEKNKAEDLLSRLRMFTLRKNVTLNLEAIQVVVAWDADSDLTTFSCRPDPRNTRLGYRKIIKQPSDIEQFNALTAAEFDFYDRLRIDLAVPDGSRDIEWESDTVADLGFDRLNAVSFTKGCYLGQELTARMHHRGLAKRGLYAVEITGEGQRPFSDILADGNLIGEMRSSNGNKALAILRHDSLPLLPKAGLKLEQVG